MKCSIICIVNKKAVYDGFCVSLASQNFKDYELIPVWNTEGEYDSARAAFNDAASRAKGKYFVFVHPDIRFLDENSLGDIMKYVSNLPVSGFGAAGAAGAKKKGNGREIVTNILQGSGKSPVGRSIAAPEEVQTLDECFFVIEKKYMDEKAFPRRRGWHLYAVEYCLEAIKDGKSNYVVPARLWHLSDGKSLDASYVLQLDELIEHEKKYFDMICTTVKAWKTRGVAAKLYRKYYYLKQKLKKKLGK